ncbi:cyclase family protein [Nocardioides panacis]|uniref:Cyclase family protein n=1 Tax=Nocardioides panacis TaxID=2849501 RepID=A0A975XZG2_9ACTN|nr:cyclase family protein [Nocardioides panacis]QWZ07401.1 cyclase family protein [Nocardioides panacis]
MPDARPDLERLRSLIDECSNWDRWGPDDQVGTLNHVTAEAVAGAAALVRDGVSISMALDLGPSGPQQGGFRVNPVNLMRETGADHVGGVQRLPPDWGPTGGLGVGDDVVILPHQAATQWDGLGHVFWEGRMWNGKPAARVGAHGATYAGIEQWRHQFVMRGVLVDVAAHHGVAALEPGYPIGVDDLEATLEAQGCDVGTGDALIVRTGMLEERRGDWGDYAGGPAPGLSVDTLPWIHERRLAAVASDTWGLEVRPSELGGAFPFHVVAIPHMGLALGEIWDVAAVAGYCHRSGRFEFLLVAPVLPVVGAAGSAVNPLAVF